MRTYPKWILKSLLRMKVLVSGMRLSIVCNILKTRKREQQLRERLNDLTILSGITKRKGYQIGSPSFFKPLHTCLSVRLSAFQAGTRKMPLPAFRNGNHLRGQCGCRRRCGKSFPSPSTILLYYIGCWSICQRITRSFFKKNLLILFRYTYLSSTDRILILPY